MAGIFYAVFKLAYAFNSFAQICFDRRVCQIAAECEFKYIGKRCVMIYGVKDSRKQPVAQIKVKFHIHIDNRRFPDNAFGNSQSFADIICSADF